MYLFYKVSPINLKVCQNRVYFKSEMKTKPRVTETVCVTKLCNL